MNDEEEEKRSRTRTFRQIILFLTTFGWNHYPYVAENSYARTWLEMQVLLFLADNTIKAYGRSANDYLAFCQRARIAFVEATKADIALYIDDMLQRSNPRGENISYLHSGVGLANATTTQRGIPLPVLNVGKETTED